MSEKTEEPTPRRLRKAASEGDVPMSGALVASAAFAAASVVLPAAGAHLGGWAASSLRVALATDPSIDALGRAAIEASWSTLALASPVLGAAAVAAVIVGGVQARGAQRFSKLAPDLSRLSPAKGLARLVSPQRVWGVARALLTSLAVVLVARSTFARHAIDLAAVVASPAKAAVVAGTLTMWLVRDVALVLLASSAIDYAIARYSWRKRLRMSKDEVRREAREAEGDPELKAARERVHHELRAEATAQDVSDATVVIENLPHGAAALRYRGDQDAAPSLIGKGRAAYAERIVAMARERGVPVVRNAALAGALLDVEIGGTIPEALYEEAAEAIRIGWEAEATGSDA